MTVCIAWLKMAGEMGKPRAPASVKERPFTSFFFQWLGRTLLAVGSSVFHYCTLKGKSAETWRVSGWRKCRGLVEMKR